MAFTKANPHMVPDVLISSCCARDAHVWAVAAPRINRLIRPKTIDLVVPDKDEVLFRSLSPANTTIRRESEVLKEALPELAKAVSAAGNEERLGWYLQQFAKMSVLFSRGSEGRYLIWDSDTVPLKPLTFWSEAGDPSFYIGDEIHPPYFESIYRALGIDKQVKFSFIAQCFPIAGTTIVALRQQLENDGESWYQRLINAIDFTNSSGFSEYELLGTFTASQSSDALLTQSGKWSRSGRVTSVHGRKTPQITAVDRVLSDYVAFEHFSAESPSRLRAECFHLVRVLRRVLKVLTRRIKKILPAHIGAPTEPATSLLRVELASPGSRVLQIGACDGYTEDPIRSLLQAGPTSAVLVEPSSEAFSELRQTYKNSENVRVVNCAAGAKLEHRQLFYIPRATAKQMDGTGRNNGWALGQGSFFRSTIVCAIFSNSFRGSEFRSRIPEWLSAIRSEEVTVVPTSDLAEFFLGMGYGLVLDVQGAEFEVLSGLEFSNLPDWIYLETDGSGDSSKVLNLCEKLGFEVIASGSNTFLRRRGE